jgi:tetratricopeptide (TPR) repeat protein
VIGLHFGNYIEKEELNEGISLLQLLEADAIFPKRLYPFLNEQLAYGYYQMEIYDKAAAALEKGIDNAPDDAAKTRWYYLIGQLWQKADRWDKAYPWFKKANQNAVNPIVSVYAKISMISYDAKNANNPWEELAYSLERMIKRDKYKPYADIIYFEMSKLAIQNNAYVKANEWLIQSIKKNRTNLKQKQKAFELLGDISYTNNKYSIAKLAYDSLQTVLKTNPNFETIQARKKWLGTISTNEKIMEAQDSLQFIYQLNPGAQEPQYKNWQKRIQFENESLKNILFSLSL